MILQKPVIKLVGDDKTPVVQIFDDKYEEDELVVNVADDDDAPFDSDDDKSSDDSDMSWLDAL